MPVQIDGVTIMTDDGKFTSDFKPSMLGDDYAGSQLFEKTPDILALCKVAHDSKSALGKKLENVINRPGKDATEEDLKNYRETLISELGLPEKAEDYDFTPPQGVNADEEVIKRMGELLLKNKVPKVIADPIIRDFNEYQKELLDQQFSRMNEQFKNESAEFLKLHPGNSSVVAARTALKAIMQFGSDEVKNAIKDAKAFDDPGNLEKLRDLGFWPSQLAVWENIGKAMKSDMAISNEGTPFNTGELQEGTAEKVIHDTYNHPTSLEDRKRRGLSY